jgi:hypothetical protein
MLSLKRNVYLHDRFKGFISTNNTKNSIETKKTVNNRLLNSDIDTRTEIADLTNRKTTSRFTSITSSEEDVPLKERKKYSSNNKHSKRAINSKTKINITNYDLENEDEVYINTVDKSKLINIGKLVLIKKKSKLALADNRKDTCTIKSLVVNKPKDGSKEKFHIAVGIADQQSVRLACDCIYPNDAYTKTSLVRDYIPSIYVRLYAKRKWFAQVEFKYAAPQYIQEQLYKNIEQNNPLNHLVTSYVLKKVYYNQVPISFNYFIRRNLSIGLGIIYNNFYGGVTQIDLNKKLFASLNDSLVSSKIVTSQSDSNFITIAKNSFQGLLQGQYQWRNFSFGARYAIGLQPYIKYNDPVTNKLSEKKSNALNIFISYTLWDSKKGK